jgi:hypothetical protein
MRRSLFLFPILIVLTQITVAQNARVTYNPPPTFLREVFTTPVEPKKYAGIDGSPFLDDNWMLARLKVSRFKVIDSMSVKLNLYERRLHFMNEKGEELQAAINFEEIDIIDKNSKWQNSVFLPGIGNDKEAFFQVITDGSKMKLVKKLIMNKWEIKPLNSEPQRKFELDEQLYLFANGILYRSSKNCSSLMDAFNNNQEVIKFISTNKIKCNKEDDLKKLVDYFNSIK